MSCPFSQGREHLDEDRNIPNPRSSPLAVRIPAGPPFLSREIRNMSSFGYEYGGRVTIESAFEQSCSEIPAHQLLLSVRRLNEEGKIRDPTLSESDKNASKDPQHFELVKQPLEHQLGASSKEGDEWRHFIHCNYPQVRKLLGYVTRTEAKASSPFRD